MKNSMRFLGIFLAGLVLLPGCMRVPSYKCRSLRSIHDRCIYRGIEKNVIVRAKALDQDEKSYFFNNYIRGNDYSIIYLSIHNLSGLDYVSFGNEIGIKQMSYQEVIESIKMTSNMSRLIGGSIFSGIALPTTGFGCLGFIVYATAECGKRALIGLLLGQAMTVLAIPSIAFGIAFLAQGIKSTVTNKRIKYDIAEKIMNESVIIPSGGQYEGLMCVKSSDFTPEFTLTLREKNAVENSITFDVDIRQT